MVEPLQQFGNRLIEIGQAEELALAQAPPVSSVRLKARRASTLALSRGFRTRAGMTAMP